MEGGSNRGHTAQKETQRSPSSSAPLPDLDCPNSVHFTGVPRAGSHLAPHHVSAQVNAEDGYGAQRQGDAEDDEHQEGGDLRDVAGQGVGDGFLQVVKDQAACGEVLRASGRLEGPCPPLAPASMAAHLPSRGRFCIGAKSEGGCLKP